MIARIIGTILLLTLPAAAISLGDAAGHYVINSGGSTIGFAIPKAGGGALSGTFGRFRGDIRINGKNIANSRVDITIFPESVRTGESRTDAFLKSDAVFDTARETEIRFRSTSVKRTGDNTAVVSGPLTARGRTGNESFNVELRNLSGGAVSFRVTGKVLRSRYGMDAGTPIYSNIVNFDMILAARRS
jgi:polyisoprenoid-binding protein YceI